jgi:divalent metal cation (Fe/Co/Zn/Cd) transporter
VSHEDAAWKLITAEHPVIGEVRLLGRTIWMGWLMLLVLLWSAGPAMLLGRLKLPLAVTMHDKVLHADACMNKADWMSAAAAMVGVLGLGLGWWWADGVAAAVISLSIVRDGCASLRQVILDLMDEVPSSIGNSAADPLPRQLEELLQSHPWVAHAEVRMREAGHVYFGEAFVVVNDAQQLVDKLQTATRTCLAVDWRVYDFVITPVPAESVEQPAETAGSSATQG